jgi:flagellar motility protein MotE (MotC chaperone)
MKTTMIREMREEIKTLRKELAAVREENGELRKELATVREEMRGREEKGQLEKADWMKRMEMIEEKMEQREKNIYNYNNWNRSNKRKCREGGGRMVRKGDRSESECKGSI